MTSVKPRSDQLSPKEVVQRKQFIVRNVAPRISPSEGAIVNFVMDRTVSFYKEWEDIPMRHFLNGVTDRKTGEKISAGAGLSESTVKRCLASLIRKGLIKRQPAQKNFGAYYSYSVNWSEVQSFANPVSKNFKNVDEQGGKIEPSRMSKRTHPGSKMTPHNNRNITTENNNGYERSRAVIRDQVLSEKHSAENSADKVNQEPAPEKINRSAHNIKGKYPADLEAIWTGTMQKAWPHTVHMGWTGKEKGHAGDLVRYLGADRACEFVEWAIRNWRMTKLSKFPAKRDVTCPEMPEFGFLFSFRKDFLDVWNDRNFYASLAGNPKAGLVVFLKNQGYSEEDAIEEAGRRDLHKARMDELADKEEEIMQLHRQLGLVYNPKHGIKHALKEAEARIAAGSGIRSRGSTTMTDTELANRAREIKEWGDE